MGDIFIACVDGLKGFPDAIEAVFPKTAVQLCLVHMVRHSLNFVGWKQRKEVAADLRLIYAAPTEAEAERQLTAFEVKWDDTFAPIGQSRRRNWSRLTPFFDYPPDIRKVIYAVKQRAKVSTPGCATIRRFCRGIWSVIHASHSRDPASSPGQQREHQLNCA